MIKALFLVLRIYVDAFVKKNKSPHEKHQAIQQWCQKLMKTLNYDLEVEMAQPLEQPCYLVCNHQSTFDPIMVLASYNQPLSFVSKIENKKLPVVGRWSKLLNIVFFDRASREGNISMLRQVTTLLKEQYSVLIFPEGTRSKSSELKVFQAGSLQPAKLAQIPIVPVTLINSYEFDVKNRRTKTLKIIYGAPIQPTIFKTHKYQEVMDIIVEQIQQNLQQA